MITFIDIKRKFLRFDIEKEIYKKNEKSSILKNS